MDSNKIEISVSKEQLAHDLAMFRLSRLADEKVKTVGQVMDQYLQWLEVFRNHIESVTSDNRVES